ncbi:MAG: hypothetical protein KBT46_03865, partial [Ruminococcus sp.]|nr:hypothetical protein [Candidatus Copronaster equi]
GQNIRWNMNSTDLYYQGKTNAKLPLEFSIKYKLNGKETTAKDLLGKSGKIEIKITIKNADAHNAKVNGATMKMYNPLIVIGGVMLSESKFQNISVINGKTIGSGNTQYAVLTGFPGIKDSLGLSESKNSDSAFSFDDTYTITADATDFDLGNFMFVAIPIASLDIGLNGIVSSVDDVRANLSKLQAVQKSLQAVNVNDLVGALSTNSNKLSSLTSLVSQASSLYNNNKALLDVIDKYTTPENLQAIQTLTDYISSADFAGLESSVAVLESMFSSEFDTSGLQSGMALLKQLSADLSNPQVKKAIDNLPNTVSTLSSLQKAINDNKQLITALQSLSNSSALQSIGGTLSGIEGSLAADSLASFGVFSGDPDVIAAKMTAWLELGKTYKIFTKKTESASSNVTFVFKVSSIKTHITSDDTQDEDETENEKEKKESFDISEWFNNIIEKIKG